MALNLYEIIDFIEPRFDNNKTSLYVTDSAIYFENYKKDSLQSQHRTGLQNRDDFNNELFITKLGNTNQTQLFYALFIDPLTFVVTDANEVYYEKIEQTSILRTENINEIVLNEDILNIIITNGKLPILLNLSIEKGKLEELLNAIIGLDITSEHNFLSELLQIAKQSNKLIELIKTDKSINKKYKQLIVYGPAGVGKTYGIKNIASKKLDIDDNNYEKQTIHTVFHPEYSYYDFFGKVMPIKENEQISYSFLPGPFTQALNLAYKNIIANPITPQKVLLVIDELNRGNAASIFGGLLNLLDRNQYGISEYPLNIYGMEAQWLKEKIKEENLEILQTYSKKNDFNMFDENNASLKIYIPDNLSIICTMNTSDQTIFSLDKAFQRRFDKHFFTANKSIEKYDDSIKIENSENKWKDFLTNLNSFIQTNAEVDDVDNATIGAYFVKAKIVDNVKMILKEDIKYTIMYYLWYDLFSGWKRESLLNNLGEEFKNLKTFEQFVENYELFINKIKSLTI